MEKYLKRLCKAILADRFNDENYRQRKSWYGKDIQTEPLFCSYGTIGFTVSVYDCYEHVCTVQWDGEFHKLTIDDMPYKDFINIYYLQSNRQVLFENMECYRSEEQMIEYLSGMEDTIDFFMKQKV